MRMIMPGFTRCAKRIILTFKMNSQRESTPTFWIAAAYSLDSVRSFCERAGLQVVKLEKGKKFRLHLVARKE